jgi:tetratricopeptide (TPR) repeat protein
MGTPGLLPDPDDRPANPLRLLLSLVFAALAVVTVWAFLQVGRRTAERDRVAADLEQARASLAGLGRAKTDAKELERKLSEAESRIKELTTVAVPPPAPAPASSPELRVLPADLSRERLAQGLQDFRSGRYAQAEICFLKAVPEGYLYLVLSALARGDLREAALFLARAMGSDPDWLRRVRPRDLFGSAEEYARILGAVEERAAQDPLDAEARLLLAYLHFHEKGPAYAKALVLEAAGAHPDHAGAKAFREALER